MPDSFHHTTLRPPDFDAYWQRLLRELDAVPLAPEEEEIPLRSTEFCTTYGVRFTGIGPYRLFGYLSIPQGEGPFPALIYLKPYRSVVEVIPQGAANENRQRFVVFSPATRGQRNADRPYAASFPGVLTAGIEDPRTYVYRGVTADCCRAVDYLLTRPEVDRGRVAAVGDGDMPLLAAALRPGLTHAVAQPAFFYAAVARAPRAQAYPLAEINDYLRSFPARRQDMARTLAYFDPLFFAPSIRIPTLMWGDPAVLAPLSTAMVGEVQVRETEHSSYKDGRFEEHWLARQMGFAEPILPGHWQD